MSSARGSSPRWRPCIALGLLIWLSQTADRLPAIGLALVIGGAIGNVIDRVRDGAVMDFLLFHWKELAWPAFNLADSAITVGSRC